MNFFKGENMTAGYGGADIIKNCNIEVRPKYNSTNEIILKFIKGEENGEQKS